MIFLVRNKTLLKTGETHPIYKYEVNADQMRFIIPQYYEDINLADCLPVVQVELPIDGNGNRESKFAYFKYDVEPYKDGYLSVTIPIGSTITLHEGEVKVWLMFLKAVDGQTDMAEFVMKTSMSSFEVINNGSSDSASETKFDDIWLHTSIDELADAIKNLSTKVTETVQWEDDDEGDFIDDDEDESNLDDNEMESGDE